MDHLSVLRDRVFSPLYCASALANGKVTEDQAASLLTAWPLTAGRGLWVDEPAGLAGGAAAHAAEAAEEDGDEPQEVFDAEAAAAQAAELEAELPMTDRLVRASVAVMGEYGLSKEDAMESMAEVRLAAVRDPRTMIDAKTKLLVAKHYSQLRVRSQALVEEQGMTKAKRAKRAKLSVSSTGGADEDEDDDNDGAAAAGNDDDDDIDLAAFAVKKKKKTTKTKTKTKTKPQGRATSAAKRGGKRA
jgi:hypothetical protein